MRWPSACKDMSLGAKECRLLKDITKQSSGDCSLRTVVFV
jgi:hypothetical protein